MTSPVLGTNPSQHADAASTGAHGAAGAANGQNAAFEALLENLELRTRSLEHASDPALGAEGLPAAVEDARKSLAQALEVKAALLEAWRAARIGENGTAA
ncbi:MAG: hypothetical protein FJ294_07160 [Planctomycetes bacterium]|nr:hypothetical protein [Planctomycetota bacterium]